LCFLQYLGSQHRWSPPIRLFIKTRHAFFAIELDGPLHTDERYPKSARNLRLFGIAIDAELSGDHTERRNIILRMYKDRHASVEVDQLTIALLKSQFRGDVFHPIRKNR